MVWRVVKIAILLLVVGGLAACGSEDGVEWRAYTAVNHVVDLALYEDQLWAATDGGVAVWGATDGELRRVWTTIDGLGHNVTNALAVCLLPQPALVVGTAVGLSLFDLAADAWQPDAPLLAGAPRDTAVTALACTDAHLAIGHAGGAALYDVAAGRWTHYPLDTLPQRAVTAIAVVEPGPALWLAHRDAVSHLAGGVLTHYAAGSRLDDPQTTGVSETQVQTMAVDAGQNVWLGQPSGLTRISPQGAGARGAVDFFRAREQRDWPFFTRVDGLAVTAEGTLWTNSAMGGVCHFDAAANVCRESFDDEPGMAGRFNNQIVAGENGRLYYGSSGGGISAYDGAQWRQWRVQTPPAANAHRALTQGADGEIWLGGHYGGYRFAPHDAPSAWRALRDEVDVGGVNGFYAMPQGMWVAHDGGAAFFDYERQAWSQLSSGNFPGAGIAGGQVMAIAQDGNDHFWFGTTAGVTVWDGRSFTYTDLLTPDERGAAQTAHLIFDLHWREESMWVATNRALFQVSAQQIRRYDPADLGVATQRLVVRALAATADGALWVGVNDAVVRGTADDNFQVSKRFGAEVAQITAVAGEAGEELWVGLVDDSLFIYRDGAWLDANERAGQSLYFGRHVLRDGAGNLWFAGGRGGGISRFSP